MIATQSTVLMVPPEGFAFNNETASSNAFQKQVPIAQLTKLAMDEYSTMVETLTEQGINVLSLAQNKSLPDAVFPNNWFSIHKNSNGKTSVIIYPLLATNRQAEVNIGGLLQVLHRSGFSVQELIDLRAVDAGILEGTGSLVLDRDNKIIYAALSARTSYMMVMKVANILDYTTVIFNSVDKNQQAIYHTNVVMSIAKHYAIVCLESIKDSEQQNNLVQTIKNNKQELIVISLAQVEEMCGNVLELFDSSGKSILILSTRATQHFTTDQLKTLRKYSRLVSVNIPTIEHIGGGSARCMMAEIY